MQEHTLKIMTMTLAVGILATIATMASTASAAGEVTSGVPRSQLPAAIQASLRSFENQFELALAQDCPAEKCFPRGCVYLSHESVDRAKDAALPGLGDGQAAPGAQGPTQEYLTAARCEYAYENTLPAKDIATLSKRLEQKLSRGYTTIGIESKPLPALPSTLKQTPTPANAATPSPSATPTVGATPGATPTGAAELASKEAGDPLRELWRSLLPHFSWMIAILLGTTAVAVIIWAFRRLGRETPEERALMASLLETDAHATSQTEDKNEQGNGKETGEGVENAESQSSKGPSSDAILRSYGTPGVWKSRMTAEPLVFEGVVRRWLREKDFASIAKLALGSQEEFRRVLPSGEEFALERAELADFMSSISIAALPSDEEFAGILSNALVASYVSEQEGDELVTLARLLREQFGSEGFADIIRQTTDRLGAVLFAVIPAWRQSDTAQLLPMNKRIGLVASLSATPRASQAEVTSVLRVVNAAVRGEAVPVAPAGDAAKDSKLVGVSHGRDLQCGQALSALLPLLPKETRRAFVREEQLRFEGATPPWCDGLFYPEMLSSLSSDARNGIFLQLDARDIAVWSLGLAPELRKSLLTDLPGSLGAVVQSFLVGGLKTSAGESRAIRERVRRALSDAVRSELHGGRLRLEEAV